MAPGVVVLLLTLLLGIQPVATDLYLPALPTLTRELATGVAGVQLTLSALIICFGVAQLVCGPLADRFGRRPVLLAGLSLFTAASIGSTLAGSIETLIAWRALQGAAMAAAVTCGRSIVRDLYPPHEGARVMSRALSGLGVIALAAPLIGGALTQWVHWRAALLMLALFGAGTLAFVAWKFEETVPARDPRATQIAPLARNVALIFGDPTFRAWVALLCCSYGGLFLFLSTSSFVFIEVLGLSRATYGLAMAANSLSYLAGTFICRRLLASHGLRRTVFIAGWFSLVGSLSALLLAEAGIASVWSVLLPQCVFCMGHGLHQPCAQAGAVGPFPDKAGTAAALSGFAMMVIAFGTGLWVGRHLDGTVHPWAHGLAFYGVALAVVAWTLVQRHGEPAAAARGAA